MRRLTLFAAGLLLVTGTATSAAAQGDPPKPDSTKKDSTAAPSIVGSWTGTIDMQGQVQPVSCTIKKADGGGYVGSVSGMQGEMIPFGEIKLEGDKLIAMANVPTPNGNIEAWYTFTLKGDTMNGVVEANVGGQAYSLPVMLKRNP